MSVAANVDLICDQGADFGVQIYWTDPNNNGYTVLSPMRAEIKGDTGVVVYTFHTNDQATDDQTPSILYNRSSGLIQLTMTADETSNLGAGTYQYDLFVTYQDNVITNATRTHRLLYGTFTVQGRVTSSV